MFFHTCGFDTLECAGITFTGIARDQFKVNTRVGCPCQQLTHFDHIHMLYTNTVHFHKLVANSKLLTIGGRAAQLFVPHDETLGHANYSQTKFTSWLRAFDL